MLVLICYSLNLSKYGIDYEGGEKGALTSRSHARQTFRASHLIMPFWPLFYWRETTTTGIVQAISLQRKGKKNKEQQKVGYW